MQRRLLVICFVILIVLGGVAAAHAPQSELGELRHKGINFKQDKVTELDMKEWGKVHLVSGLIEHVGQSSLGEVWEYNSLHLFLTDGNAEIIYEFQGDFPISASNIEVKDIAYVDAAADGLKALVIIADYGSAPGHFTQCNIYFQREKEFISIPYINLHINNQTYGGDRSTDRVWKILRSMNLDKSITEPPELAETVGDLHKRGGIRRAMSLS